MHCLWIIDIYFSANYHLSGYDMAYSTIGHTQNENVIEADIGEYKPPNKVM